MRCTLQVVKMRAMQLLPRGPMNAIVDADGAHTFDAIREGAERVASSLLASRASLDGKRVALLVSPGARFAHAMFGVMRARGCAVVLSPLHPAPEMRYFCEDAEVDTILASADLEARAREVSPSLRVVAIDEARGHAVGALPPEPSAQDDALQLYTSGTTGKPKGAVLTHGNLAMQQRLLREHWGFEPSDVLVHALPLHHMHGLAIAFFTALGANAATRMLPAFDARAVWESMQSATVFMAVPTMYQRLFVAFDQADDETRARWSQHAAALRLATSGSAALPVTLAERWKSIAGEYPLERFGMTEIGVGTSNPLVGERRPGTVGKPLSTVETRVTESGELLVAGPSVFRGYWKREDATRDAFVIDDGTKWFKTGDTVSVDADGYVKILGRTSVDILKSGGYKLSALEIEEALRESDAVAEVAVIGVPDEAWGDRVVACVVPRAGREAECAEEPLRAFAKTRLAPYKVPKQVIVMRELPRNAVGKVIKPELTKRVR
jgi:malonyl-CoA/methylmalonyl-CoA synthetase